VSTRYDISGKQFRRLFVVKKHHVDAGGNAYWLCRCDCGEERIVRRSHLVDGTTQSCGCFRDALAKEQATTHGASKIPEYQTWSAMIARCYNPKNTAFGNYGARGILVCEFLRASPVNLVLVIGRRPSMEMEIDRIDVNGGYTCGICAECLTRGASKNIRWVTVLQQARNKRNTRLVTINGVTKCASEWVGEVPYSRSAFYRRVKKGEFA